MAARYPPGRRLATVKHGPEKDSAWILQSLAPPKMNRISLKALLISLAVMLALDTLGGMILTIFFAGPSLRENATPEQTQAAVEAVNQSSGFLLSALVYGTVTTILGGYLAARLAKRLPYFNAGALGLASIAIGILLAGTSPLWFDVVGFFVTLPAALFGGHLAKRDVPGKLDAS